MSRSTPSLKANGTSETTWTGWSAPQQWPSLTIPRNAYALVVEPHPDDAVLAIGGLIKMLSQSGGRITLITVTDGEASHPESPTTSSEQLRAQRSRENTEAFAQLGVRMAHHVRLGVPDGRVAQHDATVAQRLSDLARDYTHVLAPWWGDGHPDHDATGHAVRKSVVRHQPRAHTWFYPIWAWHWAQPDELQRHWRDAARIDLPTDVQRSKAAAIAAYQSQILPLSDRPGDEAILPPDVLARFQRSWESVLG